jgi:hypothetical protein
MSSLLKNNIRQEFAVTTQLWDIQAYIQSEIVEKVLFGIFSGLAYYNIKHIEAKVGPSKAG